MLPPPTFAHIVLFCPEYSLLYVVALRADDRHHFGAHHFNGMGIPRHHPLHDPSMAMIERSLNPLGDPNHPTLTNHIAELEQLRRATHSQEQNAITAPHPVYNSVPGMQAI